MNVIIFEDNNLDRLFPFSSNHSPLELRIGAFTNFQRIKSIFEDKNIILIVRDSLQEVMQERFPHILINPTDVPNGICLNTSAVFEKENLNLILDNDALSNKDRLISFKLNKSINISDFRDLIKEKMDITVTCNIDIINNIWDIFESSKEKLSNDFGKFLFNNDYTYHPSLITINDEYIHIGHNSNIKAGVIIDASKGPIIIDSEAILDHGVILEGPNYIGKKTYIAPGTKVRPNNIIGPMCKVGGELIENNFLGYSNKVHDGFLGHSYIGEWVNIGAGTNNSNLKNNYNLVKVRIEEHVYETQLQFLGSLIGDYTRIAIGTNLNTGTTIGIGSNMFEHQFTNNYIPPFSWGRDEKVEIEKLLDTISKMQKRRGKSLSSSEKKSIEKIYSE